MFAGLQYLLLKTLFPPARLAPRSLHSGEAPRSRIRELFGPEALAALIGKTVLDFGCGEGADAIELARLGANRVIGVDIREGILASARRHAAHAGVSSVWEFRTGPVSGPVDAVVSVDAFEHFADPAGAIRTMNDVLTPGGLMLISFGPTWFHPLGGHLFSVFPWAHLLFTEKALIRWRADFNNDGATRFCEVAGGLNQMTIERFKRIVAETALKPAAFETVPIRPLRRLHMPLTAEFTTSIVRCRLVKAADEQLETKSRAKAAGS